MGNLEFVEGILENEEIWGFIKKEGKDCNAGASGNGFAPGELGGADWASGVWLLLRHLERERESDWGG